MEGFLEDELFDDDFSYDPDAELIETMVGASEHGDLESLKAIKAAEPHAFSNCLKIHGGKLIYEAVRWRQYGAADFLLCNGCSIQRLRTTAVHLAARDNSDVDFFQRLVMYADARIRDHRSNTPLHHACFAGTSKHAEILLQNGADCNDMNSSLQTPLHVAALYGHINCAKMLLQFGALVNARDSDELMNKTPLDSALESLFSLLGYQNLVACLKAFINWVPHKGDTIFQYIKSLNMLNNQQNHHNSVSNYNESLEARVKDLIGVIDVLIQYGAKFDVLILATKYLPVDLFNKIRNELVENCKLDVNARDHLKFTPLHFVTSRFPDDDNIEYFMKHGSDVNAKSITNVTPLEVALKEHFGDRAAILLIEYGANVNYTKDSGWTPLTFALVNQRYFIAESMLKHGADPNIREPGISGFTPIMRIVNRPPYSTKAIELLLNYGADVSMQDTSDSGFTALHMAAMCPSRAEKEGREAVSMMLKQVKNVDLLDNFNLTPLMRAVSVPYASIPIIRLLLDSGADPYFSSGEEDDTPLQIAIGRLKSDVINLLLEYETAFSPEKLFSKRSTILNIIAINKPYDRNELFAIRKFHSREDIALARMEILRELMRIKGYQWNQDSLDNLLYCLYQFLNGSPFELSCLSYWTHGYAVLFCEAEQYYLQMNRVDDVDESVLRGILEYRLEVIEGDSYKKACCREIDKMKVFKICDQLSVMDLLVNDMHSLTQLMRNTIIFKAISDNLDSFSDELEFPIYGETIKRHVKECLARRNLLRSASHFMNEFFARRNTLGSKKGRFHGNSHDSFSSLPLEILDNILGYLSNADLINWVISVSITDPQFINELRKAWKAKLTMILSADWKALATIQ